MRQKTGRRRHAVAVFAGLAFAAVAPASALGAVTVSAADQGIFGSSMTVTGDSAPDTINLGGDPATNTGSATAAGITEVSDPNNICTKAGDTITCTDVDFLSADGGEGNDTITIDSARFWSVSGGLGDDTLNGSDSASESLSGDEGNDRLFSRSGPEQFGEGSSNGGDGNDLVQGGSGSDSLGGDNGTDQILGNAGTDFVSGDQGDGDVVDGGAGSDFLSAFGSDGTADVQRGGPGFDQISYSSTAFGRTVPDNFSINLGTGQASRTNNGGANSDSLADIEDADTDEGNDSLTGSGGPNNLFGGGGNDTVVGGAGADSLFGNDGDDSMQDRDGFRDRVGCGAGSDGAILDQLDVQADCESVQVATVPPFGFVAPTPPTPRDATPPTCTISGLKGRQKRKAFFKGIRFRQRCNEAYRVEASLFVRVKRVRGGKVITARAGDLVLGERKLGLAAPQRTLRLKVAKSLRKRLGRRFTARVKIDTFDASGNRRTTFRSIRVR